MNRRDSARDRAGIRHGRLHRRPVRVFRIAVALLTAVAIAGCAATSATQSVTISGKNLAIYISAPTGYQSSPQLEDTIDAEKLAFQQHSSEVTGFTLHPDPIVATKPSDNARTAISNTDAIAYIGELVPGASEQTAGITNGEDLLQVSPTDTALELTQQTAAVPDSPKHFLESTGTYGKTFGRVVPNSAIEAQAQATEMKQLGVTQLYVSDDGSDYGAAMALAVKTDAKSVGITVAASQSGANGIFYGSASSAAAAKVFAADASADPSAKLFGPSALDTTAFAGALGSTQNVYVSRAGLLKRSSLPVAGQQFITSFTSTYGHAPASQAIFGYEAMLAVLDAIHAAGQNATDRRVVVQEFFATKNPADSVIGPFSIDAKGDTSFNEFVFSKLEAGAFKPVAQVQG
jgi:branched-chain amino acid transport system substrate-binding protein